MSEYKVTITEKLKRDVYVEANSLEEAQHIATENWYKGDYNLEADDFSEINFDAEEVEPQEKIKVVLLQPGKIAKVTEIDSTYEAMKEIVQNVAIIQSQGKKCCEPAVGASMKLFRIREPPLQGL